MSITHFTTPSVSYLFGIIWLHVHHNVPLSCTPPLQAHIRIQVALRSTAPCPNQFHHQSLEVFNKFLGFIRQGFFHRRSRIPNLVSASHRPGISIPSREAYGSELGVLADKVIPYTAFMGVLRLIVFIADNRSSFHDFNLTR